MIYNAPRRRWPVRHNTRPKLHGIDTQSTKIVGFEDHPDPNSVLEVGELDDFPVAPVLGAEESGPGHGSRFSLELGHGLSRESDQGIHPSRPQTAVPARRQTSPARGADRTPG